jgi:hypothetical protein
MPSTAKQAETTSYDNVHVAPFTRVHGRPTRADYKILKSEASTLASKVKVITYDWSHNATDSDDEHNNLTNIDTYVAPIEPAAYDLSIHDTTLTHKQTRKE